jgi:hypothetical protein
VLYQAPKASASSGSEDESSEDDSDEDSEEPANTPKKVFFSLVTTQIEIDSLFEWTHGSLYLFEFAFMTFLFELKQHRKLLCVPLKSKLLPKKYESVTLSFCSFNEDT